MVAPNKNLISLDEKETEKLVNWITEVENSSLTISEKNQQIVTRLGAHYRSDGLTEIGFWTPELMREVMRPRDIYLEVFTPLEDINWRSPESTVKVRRDCNRLQQRERIVLGCNQGNESRYKGKSRIFLLAQIFESLRQNRNY